MWNRSPALAPPPHDALECARVVVSLAPLDDGGDEPAARVAVDVRAPDRGGAGGDDADRDALSELFPGPLLDGSVQPAGSLPQLVRACLVALHTHVVPNAARDVRRKAIAAVTAAHADAEFPSCLLRAGGLD